MSSTLDCVRKLLVTVLICGSAMALPAQSFGSIAFSRYDSISSEPTIWIMNDDGSGKVKLGKGNSPVVSPDGKQVAFIRAKNTIKNYTENLYLIPVTGGTPTLILKNVGYSTVAWSPDSQMITAAAGTSQVYGTGSTKVVVINAGSKAVTKVRQSKGVVEGANFSPDSTQLAFAMTTSQASYEAPADVYVASVANGVVGPPKNITNNGHSAYPLWGPQKIVYVGFKNRKEDAQIYNLFTMNPDGSGATQLTKMKSRTLLSGLTPVAWSQDGTKIAANYVGQDTNQAFAVNATNGATRDLGQKKFDGTSAFGISADGQTVLVATLAFEPSSNSVVGTVPFGGGKITTLAKRAVQPSWTGLVPPLPLLLPL